MTQPLNGPPLGLEMYGFVLRRQWVVVVAGAALGTLLAAGYLAFTPATVTATADVNINVISTDPFNTTKQASSLLDGSTENQIATSYSVASDAATKLGGGRTPADVRSRISSDAANGVSVVHISFTAPTSEEARAGADAAADAYLAYRSAQAQTKLDNILQVVVEHRTELGAELADANSRISVAAAGSSESNQAISDRDLVTIELNTLLGQKSALEQIDTAGGIVLTTAEQNEVVVTPNKATLLGAGLLAGGVLGIIAAFLINPFDRTLRTTKEIQRATGSQILADIRSHSMVVPEGEETLELLRAARERIVTALPADAKLVTLLDDAADDQPSEIPANLALVMAQDGTATQLIVPHASESFRQTLLSGLDLVQLTETALGDFYTSISTPQLQVCFPSLPTPESGSSSFVAPAVWTHLSEAPPGELRLLVLGNAAPPSAILTALRLSDAFVLIAATRHSRSDRIAQILAEASRLGTLFLGTISVPNRRTSRGQTAVATTPVTPTRTDRRGPSTRIASSPAAR